MTYPEISTVTIGTTPTLVFQGTGFVSLEYLSGNSAVFGDSTVSFATPATQFGGSFFQASGKEFKATAEVYGVCNSGSGVYRVVHWF